MKEYVYKPALSIFEYFTPEVGFSQVEIANAANNLDYSSRSIADDVCRALDSGAIERRVTNHLASSAFDKLMQEIFMDSAALLNKSIGDSSCKFSVTVRSNEQSEQTEPQDPKVARL